VPRARAAAVLRRPPLSPHPEWRRERLFLEPQYTHGAALDDIGRPGADADERELAPAEQ
jgi:hypothetical protein